nr:hypothetical protein [Solirubrobacteraceae bacterium]
MKLSKPSPSIVISIAALVFAMAGTGIAAKSTLIDGAKIKNGSITSAKIRNGAITARKLGRDTIVPKGYALVLVRTGSAKKSSARSSQTSADPDPSIVRNTNGVLPGTNTPFVLPTRCELPGGEIV